MILVISVITLFYGHALANTTKRPYVYTYALWPYHLEVNCECGFMMRIIIDRIDILPKNLCAACPLV